MPELLDRHSQPCASSLLDLFRLPPTQVSIDNSYYQPIHLVHSCKAEGPWQLQISPSPHFFHMCKNYLVMTMKIVKNDNSVIKPVDGLVGPINLIAKTIFRQVSLFVFFVFLKQIAGKSYNQWSCGLRQWPQLCLSNVSTN